MPLSSVLGAQSLVRPGVCTSSTRPASPFEGQVIYETDTDLVQVYNGSGWKALGSLKASTNTGLLQVVQTTWTSGQTSSSDVWADVTNGSLAITPTSTSSKVLCFVRISGCDKYTGNTGLGLRLLRGSTTIAYLGDRIGYTNNTDRNLVGTSSLHYLDSPATTSSTTYKVQMRSYHNLATAAIGSDNPNDTHSITLMEIAG